MKALTLRHPWAFAICYWGKRIENRSWRPQTELRIGHRFAIHGGRAPAGVDNVRYVIETGKELVKKFGLPPGFSDLTGNDIVRSGIVATAVLKDVVTRSDDPWFEGKYGWVLDEVIVLPEPIRCPGAQGLWTVPTSIEERLHVS